MLKVVIIGQGSQSIQLIRELFSLGVTPDNITALTVREKANLSYFEFLSYYKINTILVTKDTVNSELQELLTSAPFDLCLSFSNPFILSKEVLLKTKCVNFHPGILPYYKGCLSTVYSLINGEAFVGGTWHYMVPEVDAGNIIKGVKTPTKQLNAFALNHKIFSLGISCLGQVLKKVKKNYPGVPQETKGRYYPNVFPNIINLDPELKKRITYFPPNYLYEQ